MSKAPFETEYEKGILHFLDEVVLHPTNYFISKKISFFL